jgi:uncharacterized paraquat-inducible protein A
MLEKRVELPNILRGATVLCQKCSCVWLVPALEKGERYRCRRCGYDLIVPAIARLDPPPANLTDVDRN